MTGNILIDLAISIGGVILLVGLARVIFGARGAALTLAGATERLAFDEPDFNPAHWLVCESGAVAVNAVGEAALVRPVGDDIVTRRFRLQDLNWRREGLRLVAETPDHAFPGFAVSAADEAEARGWAGLLNGGPDAAPR